MDLYKILGVEKDASQEEIKNAYRKKSKIEHPDVGGDPFSFAELSQAYEILGDKDLREEYDRTGRWDSKNKEKDLLDKLRSDFVQSVLSRRPGDSKKFINQFVTHNNMKIESEKRATNNELEKLKEYRDRLIGKGKISEMIIVGLNKGIESLNLKLQEFELIGRLLGQFEELVKSDFILKPAPPNSPNEYITYRLTGGMMYGQTGY